MVSIGAITNVASAILLNPEIRERIVVVWLGGHARICADTKEFNMYQDYAAARVVMSQTNFVQLPCWEVVSEFSFTLPELEAVFSDKNRISDFLLENCREFFKEKEITDKVIWDVTAVAWLINDNNRFMEDEITNVILPGYDGHYEEKPQQGLMCYVNKIHRKELFEDMVRTVTK